MPTTYSNVAIDNPVAGDGVVDASEAGATGFTLTGTGNFSGDLPVSGVSIVIGIDTFGADAYYVQTFPVTITSVDGSTFTWSIQDTNILGDMPGTSQGNHSIEVVGFDGSSFDSSNWVQSNFNLDTACFYPGTMIRSPAGDVAVEALKPGDLVLTHDGRTVPVCWLGRQTVSTVFANKQRVLPIRIKAGAFRENTPTRDLLVSPDHAMLVGGVLIQAGALVNGTSVVRETKTPQIFTYYHVETEDHSLILAEGAPAETFVDNVDRMGFDNWDEYERLYPEGRTVAELPYPRAKSRRQVPAPIRAALAERAVAIGAAGEVAAVA